jgi:FtsP/CotA-like multicopper oxidase with cupredoxin domain
MKRTLLSSLVLGPALLLGALLVPGIAAAAGPITSTACTDGGATVTCSLVAKTGTLSLPGASVPIWGFAENAGAAATVPGPTLVADQGDTVVVNLTNNLGQPVSILFGGQAMTPDLVGAAANGGTTSYTFTATTPGTYLYEAGIIPGSQYQVAMGLYGTLIVRPTGFPTAPGQAYGGLTGAATAFDDEALVVLGEIDPALTGTTASPNLTPWTFDLRSFAPKYFLINGAPYTSTASPITTTPGNKLLLRYANAGIQQHSIGVLGLHQAVLSADGSELPSPRTMVAETLGPGQSADVLITVPTTTAAPTMYALYDASLTLNNSSANGIGGMLAFIEASGTAGADTVGPLTSGVTLALASGALTASVSDATTGNANVTAAEYYIDTTAGTGTAMSGAFGSPTVSVSATIPASIIDALPSGTHTVYVRGQDSLGNWGALSSATFSIDKTGPTTSALVLNPNPSDGSVDVALSGTASDAATGNGNVVAAEYFIGTPSADGSGTTMTRNATAPTVSLTATIPAPVSGGVISVHAQDAAGNWGPFATITLTVDGTGPATSGVMADKNPNNGQLGQSSSNPSVRVTATFDDSASGGSTIATGEGFIDALGADGTGFPFTAADGVFNAVMEAGYADVPLTTINLLASGNHTIYVHGKDAAGNWGTADTTTLVIERTPPALSAITRLDPSPTIASSASWTVTFSESVVGVTSGSFSLVTGGGLTGATITSVAGTGATRTVTATTGSGGGTLGLNLTSATGIRDVAGNALPTTGLPFVGEVYAVNPLHFSTVGNTNPPGVAGTADDADIYSWDGSAFSRAIDVTAITGPLPGGANVDGFDRVDDSHFYMSFNGNVAVPGLLAQVADEDVVYYDAGAWSLFFDGSANGVGGTDLDAISIVGGSLYFSTDDSDVPPGAGGSGDDADIYRWNGGSSYTRMVDASAAGWSTANVDGFVWLDATHAYVSYSVNTTVPGLGTVQDEDVVYLNGGTWAVYFDGTSKGLTANNHDVDAFDLP